MRGRLDPLAVRVDVSENFGGADDGVGGHVTDFVRAIDDQAERATNVAVASGEEAGSMGMAIEGAAIHVIERFHDLIHTFPVCESFVDLLLPFAAADAAADLMPGERRHGMRRFGGGAFRLLAARGGFLSPAGFLPFVWFLFLSGRWGQVRGRGDLDFI